MFFLLFLVLDASVALWKHEEMARAIRHAARELSIGGLPTQLEVESYTKSFLGGPATYSVTLNAPAGSDQFTVGISAPALDLVVIGVLPFLVTNLSACRCGSTP